MPRLPRLVTPALVTLVAAAAGCAAASRKAPRTTADMVAASAPLDPGGAALGTGATGAATATTAPGAPALPDEKLVITGSATLAVDDGPAALAALRAAVEAAGGRVVHEQASGADHDWYGTMRVRLPPAAARDFVANLGTIGTVEQKLIEATDVSRDYFDQEVAIKNLRITLERLQAILAGPDLKTADVLEIERELTRVRGDLERLEGEHRFLDDRIAFATFELALHGSGVVDLDATARVHPGGRAAALFLIDRPAGFPTADRLHLGGGASLRFDKGPDLELLVFPDTDPSGRIVIATMGNTTYSDFFGDGRRRWGNPYLGGNFGYGYLGGRSAAVGNATLGVEIFKAERLTVDVAARVHLFLDKEGATTGVETSAGLTIPF